jgi:beta-glucosidase
MGLLHVDGQEFRDLDHDGVLSPYEDWRLPVAERVEDLLRRLTIQEKIGCLLHGTAAAVGSPSGMSGRGTGYDLETMEHLVSNGVLSCISRLSIPTIALAEQNNALQHVAAKGRLGIPLTISTDPRSHFTVGHGMSVDAAQFTQWPETLGFAAIGDADLVRRFGDTVRQEYRAVGFHMALFPQADLATSPRWGRIFGSFGENPGLVRRLTGALVKGLQGGQEGLGTSSVAAIVKHWVGYGASRDGFDGHCFYGRYSAFPSGSFSDHVEAFLDAFAANVAGVMPTYNILEGVSLNGREIEQVGAGFSHELIAGLLQETYNYKGLVLSDWAITRDLTIAGRTGTPPQTFADIAMCWGVEDLSRAERFAKGLNAGLDQFGGDDDPTPLLEALERGWITEQRIDVSCRKVLEQKFRLGLFENPFVDVNAAASIVGCAEFTEEAESAQRRALTVLKSERPPITSADRVFVSGLDPAPFLDAGLSVVTDPSLATVAVVKVASPFEPDLHPGFLFASMQQEGDLDFKDDHPSSKLIDEVSRLVPTIVVVHMVRPAVLGRIANQASMLIAEFGASDSAIVDALTGQVSPVGKLPFRLPTSMQSVLSQPCDRPSDDIAPLFPFGHSTPLITRA